MIIQVLGLSLSFLHVASDWLISSSSTAQQSGVSSLSHSDMLRWHKCAMSIYNVIEFEGVMHFVNRTHLERACQGILPFNM